MIYVTKIVITRKIESLGGFYLSVYPSIEYLYLRFVGLSEDLLDGCFLRGEREREERISLVR